MLSACFLFYCSDSEEILLRIYSALYFLFFSDLIGSLMQSIPKYKYRTNMAAKGRLTQQHNKRIIMLIKAKINPLHPSRKKQVYNVDKFRTFSQLPSVHKNFPLEVSSTKCLDSPTTETVDPSLETLLKAKRFLNFYGSKKQSLHTENETRKIDLTRYLEIFGRPLEAKGKIQAKTASLEGDSSSIFFQIESNDRKSQQLRNIKVELEREQLNYEQRTNLNARIRRRLNHKKLVQMNKKY